MSGFHERMTGIRNEQAATDAHTVEQGQKAKEDAERERRLTAQRYQEMLDAIAALRDNRRASRKLLQSTLGKDATNALIFYWSGQKINDSSAPPKGWKGRGLPGGHEGWVVQPNTLSSNSAFRVWVPTRGTTLVRPHYLNGPKGYLDLSTYVDKGLQKYPSGGKESTTMREDPSATLDGASGIIAQHLVRLERA